MWPSIFIVNKTKFQLSWSLQKPFKSVNTMSYVCSSMKIFEIAENVSYDSKINLNGPNSCATANKQKTLLTINWQPRQLYWIDFEIQSTLYCDLQLFD